MSSKRITRIMLWLFGIALIVAGLAIDHRFGGTRPPDQASETMVMPNASNPT